MGVSLGDSLAATFAALGAVMALRARDRTGRGQVVGSAIYEALLTLMEAVLPEWELAGYQRQRTGSILPGAAPSNVYPTRDGEEILIAANRDTVFARLAEVMGRADLPGQGHVRRPALRRPPGHRAPPPPRSGRVPRPERDTTTVGYSGSVRHLGPEVGQHNDEIHAGLLGLGADRVRQLRDGGII